MCKWIVGNISLMIVLIWISSPLILLFQNTQPTSMMVQAREIESLGETVNETVDQKEEEKIKLVDTLTEVIECTEPKATESYQDNFGVEITFTSEYICDDDVMPYALYTPSTADESGDIPLILWLHGSGEVSYSVGERGFMNAGLPAVLNNWSLEGFNAYVLCPQNNGSWNNETSANKLKAVMNKIIANYNIDTDQIIIIGHSMGGKGALYMAQHMPEYFAKLVVLSGYNPGVDISEITIPTIGYAGTTAAGEDCTSINYMKVTLAQVFGEENFFSIPASHGAVPKIAFNLDENHNNRSDLVEWIFGELEISNTIKT